MAYANVADVEKILPPDEDMPSQDSREEKNLLAALDEATDLVIGFLACEPYSDEDTDADGVPDDVPPAVRRVTARVCLRGYLNDPANMGAESTVDLMGPFSHAINWSKEYQARDFYLTDSDKMRLERYRCSGGGRVVHMPMAGAAAWDGEAYGDVYGY